MDGLMFDTEALNAAAWKSAGKFHGFDITEDVIRHQVGLNAAATKKHMQEHFGSGFDYDAVRGTRIEQAFQHIVENGMPLKPGLREILVYLNEKGLKTAIGTSSEEMFVSFYLKHATLEHEFDVIVCANDVKYGKPAPDIFLKALADLGVEADECLVLEDSYNGITAAHRAGIRSIMVPDLLPPTPEIEKLFFRKADSLADVIQIIESINSPSGGGL